MHFFPLKKSAQPYDNLRVPKLQVLMRSLWNSMYSSDTLKLNPRQLNLFNSIFDLSFLHSEAEIKLHKQSPGVGADKNKSPGVGERLDCCKERV